MDVSEPTPQPAPDPSPEIVSSRARRRRAQRRAYFPSDEAERAALFGHLARRAYPTYDLFVFSLVSGVILGLGYFLDSHSLLFFGILVAPLMMPWIGISLSVIAGSLRLFVQVLTALFISALMIFLSGWLAGFASRIVPPRVFNNAFIHSRLWWLDLLVITVGAVILTVSFVRSEQRPYLPSALLTYGLFLPLCAAGFGLGSGIGVGEIWPQGLYVFLVHFTWASFVGILTLFFMRFYPATAGGLLFTGLVMALLIGVVASLTGFGRWAMERTGLATPLPAAVAALPSSLTPEASLLPPTAAVAATTSSPARTPSTTPTSRPTLTPTRTPTATVTAEPTPILAMIRAAEGGGAFIRERPGGQVIATLGNGATVTIVPGDIQEVNSVVWVHVIAQINDRRVEGWMIQSVLQTATPVADWQPSPTTP